MIMNKDWTPALIDSSEEESSEDEDMPEPDEEEVKELVKEKDVFLHS